MPGHTPPESCQPPPEPVLLLRPKRIVESFVAGINAYVRLTRAQPSAAPSATTVSAHVSVLPVAIGSPLLAMA